MRTRLTLLLTLLLGVTAYGQPLVRNYYTTNAALSAVNTTNLPNLTVTNWFGVSTNLTLSNPNSAAAAMTVNAGGANTLVVTNGRVGIGKIPATYPFEVNGIFNASSTILGDTGVRAGSSYYFDHVGRNKWWGPSDGVMVWTDSKPSAIAGIAETNTLLAVTNGSLYVPTNLLIGETLSWTNGNIAWQDAVRNSQMFGLAGQGILNYHTNSVGVGNSALRSSPGNNNSAMGYSALYSSPGSYNSAMGNYALYSSPGSYNSAIGYAALRSSPGSYNSAMGNYALRSSPGNNNSVMGYAALYSSPGSYNSAIGNNALYSSPGSYNSAIGNNALRNLSNCVVSVRWSAQSNYNGLVWLVVGAAHGLTTGSAIISDTLEAYNGTTYLYATNILTDVVCITNAYNSSATSGRIGKGATPDYNVAIGYNAGLNVSHGRTNVYLGAFAGPSTANSSETNQLYIANKPGTPLIGGNFEANTIALNGSVTASNFTGIVLKGLAAEPAAVPGHGQIYSATNTGVAEVYVQGDDGTETQVSSHPADAPSELYDTNKFELEQHIVKEVNPYVTNGAVRWINTVRMARITELNTRAILYLAGSKTASSSNALVKLQAMTPAERQVLMTETFAEYNARTGAQLTPKIWEVEQAQLQAAYDAERARILAEYEAAVAVGETNLPTVPPVMDVRRAKPSWMTR